MHVSQLYFKYLKIPLLIFHLTESLIYYQCQHQDHLHICEFIQTTEKFQNHGECVACAQLLI